MNFHVDMAEPHRRAVECQPAFERRITPDVLSILIDEVRDRFPGFCSMASHYVKIEPNGDVFPCCRAPRELRMGNVHQEPLAEIWNGANYRSFRRRMFDGDYPEPCRRCDILVANPAFSRPTGAPA